MTKTSEKWIRPESIKDYHLTKEAHRSLIKEPVRLAVTANVAGTYDNGVDGVGASLVVSGVIFDGESLGLDQRVLLAGQTNLYENGVYYLKSQAPDVLERATDFNSMGNISAGSVISVKEGVSNFGKLFILRDAPAAIGSSGLVFKPYEMSQTGSLEFFPNGTLETGNISGWMSTNLGASSAQSISNSLVGGYSLRIGFSASTAVDDVVYRDFIIPSFYSKRCLLEIDQRSSDNSNPIENGYGEYVLVADPDGTPISLNLIRPGIEAANKRVAFAFDPIPGVSTYRLGIKSLVATTPWEVDLDEIHVTPWRALYSLDGSQPWEKSVQYTASGAYVWDHNMGAIPGIEVLYYSGTGFDPVESSSVVYDVTSASLNVSIPTGYDFSSGKYIIIKARVFTSNGVMLPSDTHASSWFANTATTQYEHGTSANNFAHATVTEWNTTTGRKRSLPAYTFMGVEWDDTNVYLDWNGITPSSTLKYQVVLSSSPNVSIVEKELGGYTKYVGTTYGYSTLEAALADAQEGDEIAVLVNQSLTAPLTISANNVNISFLRKVTVNQPVTIAGSMVTIKGLSLIQETASTWSHLVNIEGDEVDIKFRASLNPSGTVTGAVLVQSGTSLITVRGTIVTNGGTITVLVADNGSVSDIYVRSI